MAIAHDPSPIVVPGLLALVPVSMSAMVTGSDWLAYVDHYCERIAPGLWGEPFNALSNIAFFVAAGIIFAHERRSLQPDRALLLLATIAATVGVGSVLFHTFANQWTLLADLVPIAIFIHVFFFVALRRFLGLGNLWAAVSTVALLALSPWIREAAQPILGASAGYASGLISTFGVAMMVPVMRRGPPPGLLIAGGCAFVVALVFRMLDHQICASLPGGTHFLWHLFNGLTILLVLLAAEKAGKSTGSAQIPHVGGAALG